jgi:hypothetical protein
MEQSTHAGPIFFRMKKAQDETQWQGITRRYGHGSIYMYTGPRPFKMKNTGQMAWDNN